MRAIDIETTGLDFNRDKILYIGEGKSQGAFVYHNGKFDLKFLRKDGRKYSYDFDTMLAASVLVDRPESLSLDSCASHYLNMTNWKNETNDLFKKKGWWENEENLEKVKARNAKDLEATEKLSLELIRRLEKQGSLHFFEYSIMPAARILTDVEYIGMRIDVEATNQKLVDINYFLVDLEKQMNTCMGRELNWRSPKQVMSALNEKGIYPECYDHKKKMVCASTRDEALRPHAGHPIVEKLLKHRAQTKLAGYLEGWLEVQYEGRIHPTYNMTNTRTGRLSCSEPNLQQVPRDKTIRSLFIPSEGKVFVIADYAQIEPRIAAHYSQDEALLNVFKSGEDFYGSIATRVLGVKCHPNQVKSVHPELRQVAKVIGLAILYGIGPKKLRDQIKLGTGIEFTTAQTQSIIDDYFRAYPGLLRLRKYVEKKVYAEGVLTNHYGRKIRINPDDVFAQGVNTLIQSSASDACLFAQLKFANHPHAKLVALIHDEIIYEVDPEHAEAFGQELKSHMENQNFTCPLLLEYAIGKSWGDKK